MSHLCNIAKSLKYSNLGILLNGRWPAAYDGIEAVEPASASLIFRHSDVAGRLS